MKALAMMVVAGLAAIPAFGEPFQGAQVSDAAKWVVHADLDQLKQTTVGAFVVEQLGTGDMGNKMAALTAILQFDPRKDLTSATLYGKSRNPAEAVAIFRGKVNGNQLVTLLKANATYEALTHNGHAIHSWIDEKKPQDGRQYGALQGGRVLVSRGLPMLQEALDVLDGKHAALNAAEAFGAELPVREPFFVAGTAMEGFGGSSEAQLLSQTKSGRLALGEKDGMIALSVSLVAQDAEVAGKLQSIAQGLLAMGQLQQEKDPRLAALLQTVKISLAGQEVKLDMACPAEQVIGVIREKAKLGPAAPAAPAQ